MKTLLSVALLCFLILPILAYYKDGNLTVGEVYNDKIDYSTSAYTVYRLPYGIEYFSQRINLAKNFMNNAVKYTSCPDGNNCQTATNMITQFSLNELKVNSIQTFPADYTFVYQSQYKPVTVLGITYYLSQHVGSNDYNLYGVNEETLAIASTVNIASANLLSAVASTFTTTLYFFSTSLTVGQPNQLLAVSLNGGVATTQLAISDYLPTQSALSPQNDLLYVVGDIVATSPYQIVNHSYILTAISTATLQPTTMRLSLDNVVSADQNIIDMAFEPNNDRYLYILAQVNQSSANLINVNNISVHHLTVIQVDVSGSSPVVTGNFTLAHNGFATALTFDAINHNLYVVTTAANIVRIQLSNFTTGTFDIMTLYERSPPTDSVGTLMKLRTVVINNGTLYTGASWWGMIVELPVKNFCDDNAECFLDMYTNYIVIYVVAASVAALFIITVIVGVTMHLRAKQSGYENV